MISLRKIVEEKIISFVNDKNITCGGFKYWKTPLVAIANAADPMFQELRNTVCEDHFMPEDLLKNAKTVIAFFVPFTRDVVESNVNGNMSSIIWAQAYQKTNEMIKEIGEEVQEVLKGLNFDVALIPATGAFDKKRLISRWSHRHVAQIAGLGTFGLNNMLITENGCCGRLGTIVTNADIEVSVRNGKEMCLYKRNGKCKLCLERCEHGALTIERYNRFKCYAVCQKNNKHHHEIGKVEVCGKCLVNLPCSMKSPFQYVDFYDDYYSSISKSKAHEIFCEKVYGRNFCQEGMLTRLQLEKLVEVVKDCKCANMLEIGCGNGMLAEYISDKTGAHVAGVDFSEEAIKQAKERTIGTRDKLTFYHSAMEELEHLEERFEIIVAVDALYDHFVDDIPEVLKKLQNLLADGGKLIIFQSFIAEKEESSENLIAEKTYIGKALTENGFHYSVTDFTEDDKDHWKLKIQTAEEMESVFAEEGNVELCDFQINKAEKLLSYLEDRRGKRYFYMGVKCKCGT